MLPGGVTHGELEEWVRSLRPFGPEKVGTPEWKKQRQRIEFMNIVSHQSAQRKSDDVVLSSLVSHEDKLSIIVHELLVAETMRNRVYSQVLPELAASPAGIYIYVQYECVIVNLLECLMYHEEAVEALGDVILDLIDYCWRTVTVEFLSGSSSAAGSLHQQQFDPAVNNNAKKLAEMSAEQRVSLQVRDVLVRRALSCISILWFIVDRMATALPLAAINSILNKHDLLVGFGALIEAHPWTVASKSEPGKFYKFKAGEFTETAVSEMPHVCSTEAHAWFVVHYLLCDRECRKRYQYNRYRKEQITRLKRFVNEVLVDQIPALVDVQRALEEMTFLADGSGSTETGKNNMLLIDTVSPIQTALQGVKDVGDIIAAFKTVLTKDPTIMTSDAKLVAEIIDWMQLEGRGEEAEIVVGAKKASR